VPDHRTTPTARPKARREPHSIAGTFYVLTIAAIVVGVQGAPAALVAGALSAFSMRCTCSAVAASSSSSSDPVSVLGLQRWGPGRCGRPDRWRGAVGAYPLLPRHAGCDTPAEAPASAVSRF